MLLANVAGIRIEIDALEELARHAATMARCWHFHCRSAFSDHSPPRRYLRRPANILIIADLFAEMIP
jgi:hypothetical protein